MGRGTFEAMMSGFSRTPPSTTPCGPDVRISPHAVGQRSNWPAAEAVKCHIKFSHWKIPLWCGLLSEFFDHLLYVATKNQREECSVSSVSRLHVVDEDRMIFSGAVGDLPWLQAVLWVVFSALTLIIVHPACINLLLASPKVLFGGLCLTFGKLLKRRPEVTCPVLVSTCFSAL